MENKNTQLNKIEHVWTLIAENSFIDSASNNVSLTSILEQINISPTNSMVKQGEKDKLPLINIPLKIVSLWKRADISNKEEINLDARINIISPSGKQLGSLDYLLMFKPTTKRFRGNFGIKGLPFDGYGEYKIEVCYKEENPTAKWRKAGTVPIEVVEQTTK